MAASPADRIGGPGGAGGAIGPGGAGGASDPGGADDDLGSATAEIVVLLPTVMLLVLAVLQFALVGLASHALTLAVADAGATARAAGGSLSSAGEVVRHDLRALGGELVRQLNVSTAETADGTVTVSARGTVPALLPFLELPVAASSVGPLQEFRASG